MKQALFTRILTVLVLFGLLCPATEAAGSKRDYRISKVSRTRLEYVFEHGCYMGASSSGYLGLSRRLETTQLPITKRGEKYTVHWRAKKRLPEGTKMRMEFFTEDSDKMQVIEAPVTPRRGWHSAAFRLTGKKAMDLGRIAHWRFSLVDGKTVLCEKTSALWPQIPDVVIAKGNF